MNLKLKLLLYFIIIFCVAFGAYFFIANKDVAWNTYKDSEYGFSISYPSNLDKTISLEKKEFVFGDLLKSVSFHTLGPGNVGVKIYSDINFENINEFLEIKNNQKENVRFEKEKEFLINAVPVVVFHTVTVGPEQQEEHFLNEKKAVFIKDGKLFELWTRLDDIEEHEKVWRSFMFINE